MVEVELLCGEGSGSVLYLLNFVGLVRNKSANTCCFYSCWSHKREIITEEIKIKYYPGFIIIDEVV